MIQNEELATDIHKLAINATVTEALICQFFADTEAVCVLGLQAEEHIDVQEVCIECFQRTVIKAENIATRERKRIEKY